MRIGELCNREVVSILGDSSVIDAAAAMREHHVGDVIVVREESGRSIPIGILTDRDIALEIVARDVDPKSVKVGDTMSLDLTTVAEDADLTHAIGVMRDKGIRRIPVIDADEALVGILSVNDVMYLISEILIDLVQLADIQRRLETKVRP